MNQSSSGSLQTELALAQSPLEVSTPSLCLLFCSPFFSPSFRYLLFISCARILTLILISLHTDFYVKADNSRLLHALECHPYRSHTVVHTNLRRDSIQTDSEFWPCFVVSVYSAALSAHCIQLFICHVFDPYVFRLLYLFVERCCCLLQGPHGVDRCSTSMSFASPLDETLDREVFLMLQGPTPEYMAQEFKGLLNKLVTM